MAHERPGEGEVPEEERPGEIETPGEEELPEAGRKHGEHEHREGEVCEECGLTGEEVEVEEGEEEKGRKHGATEGEGRDIDVSSEPLEDVGGVEGGPETPE